MSGDMRLTLVVVADCEPCEQARRLVDDLLRDNRSLGVESRIADVDADPGVVRDVGATSHPTLVLDRCGAEQVALAGPMTKRRVLRKLLPVLYPDEEVALAQLRRQLGSPTETFPRRPLRGRVGQDDRVRHLRTVSLFAGLSRRQLVHLARMVDEISPDEDEVVTEQGQPGDEFFIVVEGSVEVRKNGRRVASLGPGDCFGEMSLLDDRPRSATVITREPCTLLTIHRSDFDRILMTNPSIMRVMLTNLCERLR